MKFITKIAVIMLFGLSQAFACDPNVNCTRQIGYYLCPTWKNPGRTCPAYANDPICESRKTVCRIDCSNINNDANKYILNSNTEIKNSMESAESLKKDIQDLVQEIKLKQQDLIHLIDSQKSD